MKASAWYLLTIAAFLSLPLAAQQPPAPPESPAELQPGETPRILETIDVRVINVDVVVTDRKGNPITGLTRDDFIVLENGRPQNVTNFYEVVTETGTGEGEPAAPAIRTAPDEAPRQPEQPEQLRRKMIIFIDNLTLGPFTRNRVFESMKEFVSESLRPGDQAMIVTWNRSLKTRLNFTSDAVQIRQTLDAIAGESALGIHAISERRQAQDRIREARDYNEAVTTARTYSQSIEHDLRQTVAAINSLMGTLGGVEGKNVMLITSEGFPMQPGRDMFYYIDDVAKEKTSWRRGSPFLESMNFNSQRLIDSVARAANANEITLYTLHAGGLVGYEQSSAENRTPISPTVQQAVISNSTDSMRLMADLTGGLATVGTNNFRGAFEKIQRDLSSYYSLGYRAGTERVDRQRSIEVKTKDPSYVTRSRRSFVEKSIDSEMNDKVVANLFYEGTENDLGVQIRTGRPVRNEDDTYRVPLEVLIPMRTLTILPRGEIFTGSFSVYIVVSNRHGDMSEIERQQHPIRIPAHAIEALKDENYIYSVDLIMEPGRGKISVGVVDDTTNVTGFRSIDLIARDLR